MKKIKIPHLGAALPILLAGSMWGSMGLFVNHLGDAGFSVTDIAFMRSAFTAVFLAVWLLALDRSVFRIKWRDLWCFVGTGVASVTFFNICYFAAIRETTMAVAAILLYTAPVFVMLMSAPLFRERLTLQKMSAAAVALVGCGLVSGIAGGGGISAKGVLLGLGAGFGYALYSIFGRFALQRGYRSTTVSLYTFIFSGLTLMPLADMGHLASSVGEGSFPWVWACLLALIATTLPYLFYTVGLSKTDNGHASIMASIEPVMAAVLGVLVLHEPMPSLLQLLGIVLVLGAIVLLNINFEAKEGKKDERL